MTVDAEMVIRRARREHEKERDTFLEFGRHLRDLRDRSGWSQTQAAQRSGVHAKTLSSFETGYRTAAMKVSQLKKLCDAYGITLAQFFAEVP